jgi:hypothetical protein
MTPRLGLDHMAGSRFTLEKTRLWYERLYRLLPDISFDLRAIRISEPPWNTLVAGYSASGVGLAAGGSIPNVLAVIQVIEKLPIDATSATRLSNPIVFSAAE